jgi:hypothetical protein
MATMPFFATKADLLDPMVVLKLDKLAKGIRDHEHFRSLLMRCEPSHRHEMYELLRYRLKFNPKPLDVYEAEAGQKAESERLPTQDSAGNLQEFKPYHLMDAATRAIEFEKQVEASKGHKLTMTCVKCTKEQLFYGESMVSALIEARNLGWKYKIVDEKQVEICPACNEQP